MMYIIDHSNGQKIFDIDVNCIKEHRTGNKLFDLDNKFIKDQAQSLILCDR